jgi:hypothetical protein
MALGQFLTYLAHGHTERPDPASPRAGRRAQLNAVADVASARPSRRWPSRKFSVLPLGVGHTTICVCSPPLGPIAGKPGNSAPPVTPTGRQQAILARAAGDRAYFGRARIAVTRAGITSFRSPITA